jgi:Protein of unknown function (DUF402)
MSPQLGPFARIVEVKRTWDGREKRFECTVLLHQDPHLVVLFVAAEEMNVHGVVLPAGTVTFGHFWTDRPYNVYHWLSPHSGATLGYYFNVAEDTRLAGDELSWRDLIVDILVSPTGRPLLLDEDEIPPDAPVALRHRIREACETISSELDTRLQELEDSRAHLWPTYERATAPRGGDAPETD